MRAVPIIFMISTALSVSGCSPEPSGSSRDDLPASCAASTTKTTIQSECLPSEARSVMQKIKNGGRFRFRKDGQVFLNWEQRLPPRTRGCYREFTVLTPNVSSRGPRRLVSSCDGKLYYTVDHYRSFKIVK